MGHAATRIIKNLMMLKNFGEDFFGLTCLFKALNLGIALGSAVRTASILNVHNRIMYCVGTAALKLIRVHGRLENLPD